jgi:hypothetical protein
MSAARPSVLRVTDALLRSLRERMLDESEPLAGLLRKCLLLGAETGSVTLRYWARKELNGTATRTRCRSTDASPGCRSL